MKFDIHYLLSPRYAKWIIISLNSLFLILIIAEFFSLLLPDSSINLASEQDIISAGTTKQDSYHDILNSSLFGVYVPNDLNEDNVQKSMLNLNLVGILWADNAEESQVIIRSSSGEEKTYKIGDKIPGGAVIKRIMAGAVLVDRDGNLESLSLPKNDLTFEPVAKPLTEEETE
ncbi:type II secretion system protein N [Legionella worsleiensis]|uniref:General secretion pathway protein C n=1 Tax=Legionella worsleiensis TaxID=45076 RepID=A0A0W1A486_9GAMM|nr:type II secretion system protein N [Legionella worsleiensis]KTD76016.1 general secretion pathway protein C [Legionella worsleiensis]STY33030.1 general secretion pathway protein C [Legionella worsleiensis]